MALIQIDPYASALNTTTCGPLDVGCCCQSNTYLSALQQDVPQACDTTDQVPIFSYINAACSDVGVPVALSTTSVALTTSMIPTTTVTTTISTTLSTTLDTALGTSLRVTGTQVAGATGVPAAVTSACPSPSLSSGASIGIIIAAFAIGGIVFAAGAVLILRRRKTKDLSASTSDVPYTPYTSHTPHTVSTAFSSNSSQMRDKPLPIFEAAAKGPRVEMMGVGDARVHGHAAELS